MPNKKEQIISTLEKLAFLALMRDENRFKIEAYKKAAHSLSIVEDFNKLYSEGKIKEIPGIGKGIMHIIDRIMHDERIDELERPENIIPSSLLELSNIKHLGAKKAYILWKELGIKNIGELEYALKENRLLKLKGFGEKTQKNLTESIEEFRKNQHLFRLDQILKAFLKIKDSYKKISLVGNAKRGEITAKQLEILVLDNSIKKFTTIPIIVHICPKEELFGIYELFLTGDEDFLENIKTYALKNGFSLSLTGLFKQDNFLPTYSEEELFSHLDLHFIDPLNRNKDEILITKAKEKPKLIELKDLKGAFHNHTLASDGVNTIEEMKNKAIALGLSYISINDHSKSAMYAQGLKNDELLAQMKAIEDLNKKDESFYIFSGTESDILGDGSLDFENEILENLEVVIASVHSRLKQDKEQMTKRLIKAIENPYTTIIGHPTGRLILDRKESQMDMEKILKKASEFGVVMELNAHPHRLDLSVEYLKMAKEMGVMIAINPDAHNVNGFYDLSFGIMMARKASLTPNDVINTLSLNEIKKWLRQKQKKNL